MHWKGEIRIKYDIKKWKIESEYDLTEHVVNLVTMIQFEDLYCNVSHACYTASVCIFDTTMLK